MTNKKAGTISGDGDSLYRPIRSYPRRFLPYRFFTSYRPTIPASMWSLMWQ